MNIDPKICPICIQKNSLGLYKVFICNNCELKFACSYHSDDLLEWISYDIVHNNNIYAVYLFNNYMYNRDSCLAGWFLWYNGRPLSLNIDLPVQCQDFKFSFTRALERAQMVLFYG